MAEQTDSLLRREVHLTVDNDVFLLSNIDQYYSSGLFLNYNRLIRSGKWGYNPLIRNSKYVKAIMTYSLQHRLYTPKDVAANSDLTVDRPFAGWLDVGAGLNYFYNNAKLTFTGNLGWIGPGTQTGRFHVYWHDIINVRTPRGWKNYQIDDMPVAQLGVDYKKRILGNEHIDVTGELSTQMGTVMRNLAGVVQLRIGFFSQLSGSMYGNGKLGQKRVERKGIPKSERTKEFYLFYRHKFIYSMYDATIEGTLVGESNKFEGRTQHRLSHDQFGLARSGHYFDWLLAFNQVSPRVVGAGRHIYITIGLSYRF